LAAELALPHRMKKQPFQDSMLHPEQLQSNLRQARAEAEKAVEEDPRQEGEAKATADEKKASRAMSRS
jgi:Mg-chelatase subunit ChlI